MLTKTDLGLIRQLIREEVPPMIQKELIPLRREIDSLRKEMHKEFKRVNRKINIVISGFDTEILDTKKRFN